MHAHMHTRMHARTHTQSHTLINKHKRYNTNTFNTNSNNTNKNTNMCKTFHEYVPKIFNLRNKKKAISNNAKYNIIHE